MVLRSFFYYEDLGKGYCTMIIRDDLNYAKFLCVNYISLISVKVI
jgi:hypothetical protein